MYWQDSGIRPARIAAASASICGRSRGGRRNLFEIAGDRLALTGVEQVIDEPALQRARRLSTIVGRRQDVRSFPHVSNSSLLIAIMESVDRQSDLGTMNGRRGVGV